MPWVRLKAMDDRAQRRAEARARAGVSTRGVEVAAPTDARSGIVNATGEGVTALIEDLLGKHGEGVDVFAAVLEGIMLNAAWHLYANAETATPMEFRRAFVALAGEAADEVTRETESPAG